AEARTYWTADESGSFRDHRLAEVVSDAAAAVPFYHARIERAGASPSEVKTLDDLSALPVLTKVDVQEHARELVSLAAASTRHVRTVHTSGTTGGGLHFPVTLRAVREQWATWWRYRLWHGIRFGTWCALFAGRSIVPVSRTRPPF